jgi:hypothetical protein
MRKMPNRRSAEIKLTVTIGVISSRVNECWLSINVQCVLQCRRLVASIYTVCGKWEEARHPIGSASFVNSEALTMAATGRRPVFHSRRMEAKKSRFR